VRDTTVPVLSAPANMTVEATSAAGAVVLFAPAATDAVTVTPTIVATPASGSTFPLGTTTVNVSATDAAGNFATAGFTVTVRDRTAPSITLLGANPAVVIFGAETFADPGATAVDSVDGNLTGQITVTGGPEVTSAPGSYTVTYNVSDTAGNTAVPVMRTVLVVELVAPELQLECLGNSTNDTRISFQTVLGLEYALHASTDLIQWEPLDIVSGDGFKIGLIHTGGGSGEKRFYKVTVAKSQP
jgi:hypothetical protein